MYYIALSVIIRPLTAVVLLLAAAYIAHLIRPLIPDGRLKSFLYKRHDLIRQRR